MVMILTPSVTEIRNILNMNSTQELSDDAINAAIQRADVYINALAAMSNVNSNIVELAKKNYAAYLAYQTYSDRVVNQLPGSVNSEGIWTPTGEVIMREVRSKLDMLRATASESIRMIVARGPAGRIVRPGFLLF